MQCFIILIDGVQMERNRCLSGRITNNEGIIYSSSGERYFVCRRRTIYYVDLDCFFKLGRLCSQNWEPRESSRRIRPSAVILNQHTCSLYVFFVRSVTFLFVPCFIFYFYVLNVSCKIRLRTHMCAVRFVCTFW